MYVPVSVVEAIHSILEAASLEKYPSLLEQVCDWMMGDDSWLCFRLNNGRRAVDVTGSCEPAK